MKLHNSIGLFTRTVKLNSKIYRHRTRFSAHELHCVNSDGHVNGQNGPRPVRIDTMLNFDGDFDGHDDGDVTCKQTFITWGIISGLV